MKTELRFGNRIDAYQDDMLHDLAELVAIPSVCGKPEGNLPYGAKSAEALDYILRMAEKMGFSRATYYAIRNGQSVSTNTIDRLCHLLQCRVEDVMEHIEVED